MKLPRFTVRRLMAAVAYSALIFGGAVLIATARQRLATAALHAESEEMALQIAACGNSWIGPEARYRRLASHHASLKLKYRVAAR